MVETLIYESPHTEEESLGSTTPAAGAGTGWTKSVKNKNLRSVIGSSTVPDSLPEETISLLR